MEFVAARTRTRGGAELYKGALARIRFRTQHGTCNISHGVFAGNSQQPPQNGVHQQTHAKVRNPLRKLAAASHILQKGSQRILLGVGSLTEFSGNFMTQRSPGKRYSRCPKLQGSKEHDYQLLALITPKNRSNMIPTRCRKAALGANSIFQLGSKETTIYSMVVCVVGLLALFIFLGASRSPWHIRFKSTIAERTPSHALSAEHGNHTMQIEPGTRYHGT